jgi:hypothetical protein
MKTLNHGTMSYLKFKKFHYAIVGKTGYRLGQHFINMFIKREDNAIDYISLWESKLEPEVDDRVNILITNNQWDTDSLVLLRPLYCVGN